MRADGVEPSSSAYQAEILPLNDARMLSPRICSCRRAENEASPWDVSQGPAEEFAF